MIARNCVARSTCWFGLLVVAMGLLRLAHSSEQPQQQLDISSSNSDSNSDERELQSARQLHLQRQFDKPSLDSANYALIADGLGLNLIKTNGGDSASSGSGSHSSGPSYYTSSKRARKLSAFMPMRGRKDGRDDQFSAERMAAAVAVAPEEAWQPEQMRDVDSAETSIGRLLVESFVKPSGASELLGAPEEPVKRFARQVASHRAQLLPPLTLMYPIGRQNEQIDPLPVALPLVQPAPMAFAQPVIEAKYRRAFHPMRGKRIPRVFTYTYRV